MNLSKTAMYFMIILLSLTLSGFAQNENEICTVCHNDEELTGIDKNEQEISMFVTDAMLNSSTHEGFACIDCHSDLDGFEDFPHEEELEPVDCGICHDDYSEIFDKSAHSITDNIMAPTCASCHGTHNILNHENPEATTSLENLPYTCSDCHSQKLMSADPDVKTVNQFDRYMKGIHAEGIAKGIGSAASCDDCHEVHDLKRASDPKSMVNKMNIPKTCAKCHNDIFIQYSRGIHGKALAVGILDSPNCSDCHGEHEILEISDPNSPVNATNLSDYVCGRCHSDPQMMEKYNLGTDRFSSFQDTYHGMATRGGSIKAATCASCHEAHDILPSSNPASSIHPNNLTATCQKCHVGANEAFSLSYTHETALPEYNKLNDLVEFLYIILIVVVIGGMIIHNLIIFGRYLVLKYRAEKKVEQIKRFGGHMILQHMLITITFIALVITGFALRYPDEWWVGVLNFFGIYEPARGVIHRVSAVILLYASVHHVLYLLISKRGHFHFKNLLPTKKDLTQPIENMKYYLGLQKDKPQFDYYDYTEKAEYWSLIWGTLIMAFTGFVLWFPTFFTSFLPPWIIKISETVHFYEAWLATLAIVIFHFFFVIFHPDKYPMSLSWITGKISYEEAKHHHPVWFDKMIAEEREKRLKEEEENKHKEVEKE